MRLKSIEGPLRGLQRLIEARLTDHGFARSDVKKAAIWSPYLDHGDRSTEYGEKAASHWLELHVRLYV